MKNIGKLAVLGAVFAASASYAFADTIPLASYGLAGIGGYTSPTTGAVNTAMQLVAEQITATVPTLPPALTSVAATEATELNPESPTWNAAPTNAAWVGINANAGPQSTTDPAYGYYEFQTTFTGAISGTLNVEADDTVEVLLNNAIIVPFGALGSDGHCADNAPTCSALDSVAFSSAAGSNTLDFIVEQGGTVSAPGTPQLDPSGFAFDVDVPTPTPEPSSLLLLGTGLVGAAGMMFRKRAIA